MDSGAPGTPVPSPCVRNCCLDDDGICLGCGRAIQEIIGWNMATQTERREIVSRSRQRLQVRRRLSGGFP